MVSEKITIYDVANKAGVSIATVSRVLNSPERVSKKNRDKVLAAIDELGFIPKADARDRARKSVGRIGVVSPFFTEASFVQRFRGIANALVETQFEFTIYPVDSLSRLRGYYAKLPFSGRLDGLIVISLPIEEKEVERLNQSNMPIVFIENRAPGCNSVEIDNVYGGRLAAQHLVEKGHTRCAYVGDTVVPEYTLRPEDQRFDGYKQYLNKHGIALPEKFIKLPVYPPKNPDSQASELLVLDDPPTAIFCASDALAMRILKAARKKNIQVPEELAIVGFDDIDLADYLDLTTINQSLDNSGTFAVEILLAQISDSNRPTQNINLQLKLIERGTT